ncbi:MAG: hypothetical protein AB1750_11015 [Chloroflexota bacterium]
MAVSTLSSRPEAPTSPQAASLPDPQPASVSVLALNPGLTPVRRLVVLTPTVEMDETELARRVWELASPPQLAVLYLALCEDSRDESRLRRRLATLAALTRDKRIAMETRFVFGRNWTRKVRSVLQEGDVILCQGEHAVGWRRWPIAQVVEKFGVPVWILKGLDMTTPQTHRNPFKEFAFWSVSLAILAGFLWFQTRLLGVSERWAQNALLYLSIPLEIGLLWVWHRLLS